MNNFDKPFGFGMYTIEGDLAVEKIVLKAYKKGWDWSRVERELYFLADMDAQVYGEATDTVVRESVYSLLFA